MKLADKIKFRLIRSIVDPQNLVIPNFYFNTPYEMDVCKITKSGYIYEYEIKISRSDFFADFKKGNKHDLIKQGKRCNYFTFVFPQGLIKKEEIPDDYSAIEYKEDKYSFTFNFLKTGKRLSKQKFIDYKMLCEKLNYRNSIIFSKYNKELYKANRYMKAYYELKNIINENKIKIPYEYNI